MKTNLILRRNRHNCKLSKETSEKSIETRGGVKTLSATVLSAVMFWRALFGIPGAMFPDLHTLTSIRNDGFLILDDFSFASIAIIYNVFYESKDFESYLPYAFTELEVVEAFR